MKTTITNLKSGAKKLSKVFLTVALISLGIKANAQCAAGFTFSVSPANDGIVSFSNISSSGSAAYYDWTFGDGGSSTAFNPTYTYAISGTYTACLFMWDSLTSCTDTVCYAITVTNNSAGGCSAYFVGYDSVGYGFFSNQSTGPGLTSMWTFGDGTSGTSTGDISHLYPGTGVYYVCLTISNTLGCSSTYCDSIRIGTPGSSGMCLGSVDATFSASDSVGTVTFTNNATGTGPVYFWDFGDGTSSSVVGSTSHYYSPGTYTVCLTVYETGGTYDSCQYCSTVTVGSSSGPCDATFTIVQDSSNLFNYFIYNNTTSSSPTMTYFWDFGDGTSSTLQYPSHTYPSSGPYYLCLTVTDSSPLFSCTNTFCDSLAAGHASVPITVSVVNTTTNINEAAVSSSLENYPNPFSGSTIISYSVSKEANVELNIVDLLGNRVAALENNTKAEGNYTITWNAENVAEGMYLIQMKVNGKVSTRKIIISK